MYNQKVSGLFIFFYSLGIFSPLLPVSCLEYHDPSAAIFSGENLPPFIDKPHVRPSPAELFKPVKLGNNCKTEFWIPPIQDPNKQDSLYYLWFIKNHTDLYGKPFNVQAGIIHNKNRDNAVISLTVDRHAIETALKTTLTPDFFTQSYLIEFYVSDKPYLNPANRYTEHGANEDYMHWSISFTDQDC